MVGAKHTWHIVIYGKIAQCRSKSLLSTPLPCTSWPIGQENARRDHRLYILAHGSLFCLAELLRVELVSVSLLPDHFIHCCSRVFGKRLDPEGVFLSHQVLDERASHVHTSRDTRSSPELAIDGPSGVGDPVDVGVGGLEREKGRRVNIELRFVDK